MASRAEEDLEQSGSAVTATTSQLQQAEQGEAEEDNQCCVCLDMIKNAAFVDGCFHSFCFDCIKQWASTKMVCLLCRQPFSRFLHTVRADDDYQEYVVGSCTHQAREQVRSRPLQQRYNLRPRPTTNQSAGQIGGTGRRQCMRQSRPGPRPSNASAQQPIEEHPACLVNESVQYYDMSATRERLLRFVETE